MSDLDSTPAPKPPPGAPTDWVATVRGNAFSNAQRLALWGGGTTRIDSGADPSRFFQPLGPKSVGAPVDGVVSRIYVVTHGWAPEYRSVVDRAGDKLRFWESNASLSGRWLADWCWAPFGPRTSKPNFGVNPTGLLQQIILRDPSAAALVYSWIDDSATINNNTNVYQSEARTHVNGIRLANALQEVIDPDFFKQGGELHLIGHSHGSRVCTVAAYTLQQRNVRVAQLTILDSPESRFPLTMNGANLLAYYLEQMDIRDPSNDRAPGAFVDIYPSYFGVGYTSASDHSPLDNVVDVQLAPSKIYGTSLFVAGDLHAYAAGWYGAAAAGAAVQRQPPVGLAWPPVQKPYDPALNQRWSAGEPSQATQWLLTAGTPIIGNYSYSNHDLDVAAISRSGRVTGDPKAGLVFSPASPGWQDYSTFIGSFANQANKQFGFAFDVEWNSPQKGDYLVVSAGKDRFIFTLLVVDGQSAPIGKTTVAINSMTDAAKFNLGIYFLGSSNFDEDHVRISNFRWIQIDTGNGPAVADVTDELAAMDAVQFAN